MGMRTMELPTGSTARHQGPGRTGPARTLSCPPAALPVTALGQHQAPGRQTQQLASKEQGMQKKQV